MTACGVRQRWYYSLDKSHSGCTTKGTEKRQIQRAGKIGTSTCRVASEWLFDEVACLLAGLIGGSVVSAVQSVRW